MSNNDALLEVCGLSVSFSGTGKKSHTVNAVQNVSFNIKKGETLGLVGESGCGKTTLGRTIIRLQKEDYGRILLNNVDLCSLKPSSLRSVRKQIQMIFQNPYSSLNPRMTVLDIISEPFQKRQSKKNRADKVAGLMQVCGLEPEMMHKFPHEFSGGQRQRIAIARAIAADPLLIIADEPVSSLDVSVQAQILNVLRSLRDSLSLTMLFISHDLSVVRYISQRVAVMYAGKIVEIAPVDSIFRNPRHPYTRALLDAVPVIDTENTFISAIKLTGDDKKHTNAGCPYLPLCRYATSRCSIETPHLVETAISADHQCSCIMEKSLPN